MNNKNSIAAISALIALSLAKSKRPSGNRNLYVLKSYKEALTNKSKYYYINHSWFNDYNNRTKLLSEVKKGNTVRLSIHQNSDMTQRYAIELFENLKKSDAIYIDNNCPTVATYIKQYLIPNLYIIERNWEGRQYQSNNEIKLIRINGANLTDDDFQRMTTYSKSFQFLDLSNNLLRNPGALHYDTWRYRSLLELDLSNNPNLESIDRFKHGCQKLVSIKIKNTNLESFPVWLTKISTLEEVDVDSTCIFPNSVNKLTKVKRLDFTLYPNKPFNKTIANWSGIEQLDIRPDYNSRDGRYLIQDIPQKIYKMNKLKKIRFRSWWGIRHKVHLKFSSTKNNLMNNFAAEFEKTKLSGRYDHFLSKAKRIKFWQCDLGKVRRPIENETTLSVRLQYSNIPLPIIYTMKNLTALTIKNPTNVEEITEIDFYHLPKLKNLLITGVQRKKIPLSNLKNIDQLTLTSINIKSCKSANIENIDVSKLRKITIHKIDDIVKLPTLLKDVPIKEFDLKNVTLESLSPIINMNCQRAWVRLDNVTLLNGLTKKEELILLNNQNIDNWTKKKIMKLLRNVVPRKTIRTR